MTNQLSGRRVVITGSGGISSATAERLVASGARVHVIGRSDDSVDALRARVPQITTSLADLSADGSTIAAFDEAESALGGIDGLVAVAGGSARRFGDGPIDHLSREGLDATLALNLATTANSLREFVRRRLDREGDGAPFASAVLIGSSLGRYPASPLFVTHGYAAAKAAIDGLARSAAAHYAGDGITVNVVAPGLTRTPMAERAQLDETVSAFAREKQPLTTDGFVESAEVAEACAYMLGAPTTTGQVLYIDGGWSVSG